MATQVRHRREQTTYELILDGEVVGVADYRVAGDAVVFTHTEIDPAKRGQGLGAVLVRHALEDVRGSHRRVVPQCWYVAAFIDEHPEYRELLAA